KVEGVSEVNAAKGEPITFETTDAKAATAGVKALIDAGFFGTATDDGKEVKVEVATPKKGDKADEITIKGIHVCCGQCKTGLKKALPSGVEIAYEGEKAQKDVTIKGKDLDKAAILTALRKAGFNGKIE